MIDPSRRSFLIGGIAALITAPAIVRAASLMPVKRMPIWDEVSRMTIVGVDQYGNRVVEHFSTKLFDFSPASHIAFIADNLQRIVKVDHWGAHGDSYTMSHFS